MRARQGCTVPTQVALSHRQSASLCHIRHTASMLGIASMVTACLTLVVELHRPVHMCMTVHHSPDLYVRVHILHSLHNITVLASWSNTTVAFIAAQAVAGVCPSLRLLLLSALPCCAGGLRPSTLRRMAPPTPVGRSCLMWRRSCCMTGCWHA